MIFEGGFTGVFEVVIGPLTTSLDRGERVPFADRVRVGTGVLLTGDCCECAIVRLGVLGIGRVRIGYFGYVAESSIN
jgi:hypothetical protein